MENAAFGTLIEEYPPEITALATNGAIEADNHR